MKIVVTGNPNSGKTTLYNKLTGKNERVGNWHGVTVGIASSEIVISGEKCVIYDLPGLNSFKTLTLEEEKSAKFLKDGNYDLIINVIEAVRFDSSLRLLGDLISLNKPILCVINMYEDLVKRHGKIDFGLLNDSGNIRFLKCDLSKSKEVGRLKRMLSDVKCDKIAVDSSKVEHAFTPPEILFSKADNLFTSKWFCAVITVIVGFLSYYLAFGKYGIAKPVGDVILYLFTITSDKIYASLNFLGASEFLSRLIRDGVFAGIGGLLGFLPPVVTLNFILIYLEQSGIISRLSFAFDGNLSKIGLNGRAIFTLISGFGCTTLAVASSGGVENEKVQRRLIFGLPFLSCSAKMPVYFYVALKIFKNYSFLAVAGIYVSGVIFSLLGIYFNSAKKDGYVPLIMELPALRLNCLKNTVKPLINSVKQFIIKLSTIVLLVSIAVYLLSAVGPGFVYLNETETDKSFLAYIGRAMTVLLYPIGVNDYKIATALFAGIFAKEAVLSTLATLSCDLSLSVESALAVMVLIAFYPPCLTAIFAIRREIGVFGALYVVAFHTSFGLLSAYITYSAAKNPVISLCFCVLIPIIIFLLKLKSKNEKFCCKRKN